MAETSAYLTRLNLLKEQIRWENSSLPEMSERMRMISILLHIQDTIEFFQKETKRAKERIPLHFDEGVNYLEWCNPAWIIGNEWMSHKKEIVEDYQNKEWIAHSESIINDTQANELSGYLPKSIKREFVDTTGRNDFGRAMQLMSGPYFNMANLKLAIYSAAQNLAMTLQELKRIINTERSAEEYEGMMNGLWTGFNSAEEARKIFILHENDKQESSEDISFEWLENRRNQALQAFKASSFFAAKMNDTGNDPEKASKRIYSIQDDNIVFDKNAEVGKFIHKRHISREQITEFFTFRKKVELIQEDMLTLREKVEDIFPKEKDFSNTVFEKNRDARAIYNKLYQLVKEENLFEAKKLWYIVYIVFKEKNWLRRTAGSTFAKEVCSMYKGIDSDTVWKPNATDFKEIDSYYKKRPYDKWDESDADAPKTCADYKRIAMVIHNTFDRTYLL